jgi:hypothetical protein
VRLPTDLSLGPGDELLGPEKPRPVVRLRSVVRVPDAPDLLALAFVHREAARPGRLAARIPSGASVEVTIEQLPFQMAGAAARGSTGGEAGSLREAVPSGQPGASGDAGRQDERSRVGTGRRETS